MKRVLVVLLSVIFCFGLVGCGSPTPSDVTKDFLNAVKENNNEALKDVYQGKEIDLSGNVYDLDSDEFTKYITKNVTAKIVDFDFEIKDEKVDGDKATVKVAIKTYNFGEALENFISDYFGQALTLSFSGASEEQITKVGLKLMKKNFDRVEKNYEATVPIQLEQKDGKWVVCDIDNQKDLYNALLGNMVNAVTELEKTYETSDDK